MSMEEGLCTVCRLVFFLNSYQPTIGQMPTIYPFTFVSLLSFLDDPFDRRLVA